MSRTADRQISFADWELMRQGLRLEPLLQAISDFLDDQKDIIEQVRCDLARGLKRAETGRSGPTPQQVLRSLVLMRVKNWRYRELRERIADGYTLRAVLMTSFLRNCPPDIRRVIYTTNTIEAVNRQIRKVIKTKGSFPSDDATLKLIYPDFKNAKLSSIPPAKEWKQALAQFAILFHDRLPA